jgi:phenylacetate-coenzyme A ligase PaaK-like adenylate-forming protein
MTASMRDAWGIEPHDCLGMTEAGIVAVDCREHAGLHVFEDLTILEVVDAHGRPVPPRTVGAKVLVTNLTNFVQPIIRYEVSDLVAIDPAPCRCGINLARIVALDGRSDDILDLPGPDGRARIHPIVLRGLLGARPEVLQYQVVQRGARLDVDVVLASGLAGETTKITTQLARRLTASLRDHGADVVVEVRAVPSMVREPGASKLKLVRAG